MSPKPRGVDVLSQVSAPSSDDSEDATIDAASACLDRFTERFNACDAAGLDAELHFPHFLLSGAHFILWARPGCHPDDFFDALKRTGWRSTRYDAKRPVLVSSDKVHFVVEYSRVDEAGEAISRHRNLWVVSRVDGRWGISLRSY